MTNFKTGDIVIIRYPHRLVWGIVDRTFGPKRCYVKPHDSTWEHVEHNSQMKKVTTIESARAIVKKTEATYAALQEAERLASMTKERVFNNVI